MTAKTKKSNGSERQVSYGGILAEPMPQWTLLTQPPEEEVRALLEKKMRALFAHYGIDPDGDLTAWAKLATNLANAHVPGFQPPPRRQGAPARRQQDDITMFMWAELLMRRDGINQTQAIRQLAHDQRVQGTEETLKKRYERSKKAFQPMKNIFDWTATQIGQDRVIQELQASLLGDENEMIHSPN